MIVKLTKVFIFADDRASIILYNLMEMLALVLRYHSFYKVSLH